MSSRTRRKRKPLKKRKKVKKYLRYERMINRLNKQMLEELQEMVNQKLVPEIEIRAKNYKADIKQQKTIDNFGDSEYMERLIDGIEAQFALRFSREYIKKYLQDVFQELGYEAEQDLVRSFGVQSFGLALSRPREETVQRSTTQSLGKIKNLYQSTLADIRAEVSLGLQNGERWESVAKRVKTSLKGGLIPGKKPPFRKAWTRAKLIARNEIGTALGNINKDQQTSVGVRQYRWETADDERVRDSHRVLDGKVFSWEGEGQAYDYAFNGGNYVIPGEAYNCRCVAIPIIPEIEGE